MSLERVICSSEKFDASLIPEINFDFSRSWSEKYDIGESQIKELLDRAEDYVFSMGVQDTASHIGELVSKFFVAKMFYVQNKLGLPLHASVIQAPDATIQTSKDKFTLAVPESAKISWGTPDFIPAELEFDFCGMEAVGINRYMETATLVDNIQEMKRGLDSLDGKKLDTDCFVVGNHFANIYEIVDNEKHNLPPYIGITHLSSEEFRLPLMEFVRRNAQNIETPFGMCSVLQDDKARQYWEMVKKGNVFALKKRNLLTQEIFKSDNVISNEQHYTMIDPSSCIIGCNLIKEDGDAHVIVTKAGGEAYLVKGKRNLSESLLENFNIKTDSPIYEELLRTNILPHGSGHRFVEDTEFNGAKFTEDGILYLTRLPNGTERVARHYNGVPTTSRESVLPQVLKYDLVHSDYVTLTQLCSVKV